jgi:NAD(P)-dependent dehydrogenase (short-subunit alcohol dehydrogenase family)
MRTDKLYVTALAMACAERQPGTLVHVVDPGWVPTRMGGPGAPDSLEEGHRTQEWLATAPASAIEPRTGGYWFHRATRRPHPAAHDPAFQDALLRKLEEHTGIAFP